MGHLSGRLGNVCVYWGVGDVCLLVRAVTVVRCVSWPQTLGDSVEPLPRCGPALEARCPWRLGKRGVAAAPPRCPLLCAFSSDAPPERHLPPVGVTAAALRQVHPRRRAGAFAWLLGAATGLLSPSSERSQCRSGRKHGCAGPRVLFTVLLLTNPVSFQRPCTLPWVTVLAMDSPVSLWTEVGGRCLHFATSKPSSD